MNIENEHGLRILQVGAEEALERDWHEERPDADVVRVTDPDVTAAASLEAAGFVVKPRWMTWIAPAYASEDEFFQRMSRRSRRSARNSAGILLDRGIAPVLRSPLTVADLDRFLGMYEAHVATLRNGIPFARRIRDSLVAELDRYYLVEALDRGGDVVGACLCETDAEASIVRIRFTALSSGERDGNLARTLYLTAFGEARENGIRWVSLGSDPSTYGHLVQPGLFVFKSRFGFFPVPMGFLRPDLTGHYTANDAERALRLSTLSDPSLFIGYEGPPPELSGAGPGQLAEGPDGHPAPPVALRMEVLTHDEDTDIAPYHAKYLTRSTLRVIRPDGASPLPRYARSVAV
ncbi:hypothetical protein ACFVWY_26715 [Streptomyces sp. NPDC058195]|uniref:hypothetical protein n=1 Tax=Streptomyces sp. NPDC058195 TaxID=3346375 RepID=UPI0036E02F7A